VIASFILGVLCGVFMVIGSLGLMLAVLIAAWRSTMAEYLNKGGLG
jgi:hypothetical protein